MRTLKSRRLHAKEPQVPDPWFSSGSRRKQQVFEHIFSSRFNKITRYVMLIAIGLDQNRCYLSIIVLGFKTHEIHYNVKTFTIKEWASD